MYTLIDCHVGTIKNNSWTHCDLSSLGAIYSTETHEEAEKYVIHVKTNT